MAFLIRRICPSQRILRSRSIVNIVGSPYPDTAYVFVVLLVYHFLFNFLRECIWKSCFLRSLGAVLHALARFKMWWAVCCYWWILCLDKTLNCIRGVWLDNRKVFSYTRSMDQTFWALFYCHSINNILLAQH